VRGRCVRLFVLLLGCAWGFPALGEGLVVVVHPEREASVDLAELSQIYLRKRRFWSDGAAILPINREAGSDIRSVFERAVFGAEQRRLPVYWNREYFRGVLPPPTLASGAAVKRFVAGERRAIGYLRSSEVDGSVRAVLVLVETDSLANVVWPVAGRALPGRLLSQVSCRSGAACSGLGSAERTAVLGGPLPESADACPPRGPCVD
jgi:hypothetical protein